MQPSKWEKFKLWAKTPQGKKTLIISGIVLIILIGFFYTLYNRYFKKISTPQPTEVAIITSTPKIEIPSKLDGQEYVPEDANRHPLAIIVENHTDARPQSGLSDARIVYEATAEGGITRFLAIYGPKTPDKVGPVRSIRTYFIDWDLEYDAFLAHVGGNIDALDEIPKLGVKDLDQFSVGNQAYWREPQKGKATEHTMYTNTKKLYDAAKEKGWDINSSNFTALDFKTDADLSLRPESQTIKINFSSAPYNVMWKYNKSDNNYTRYQNGTVHKDAVNDKDLTAKNIIVQYVSHQNIVTRINEQGQRMETIGEGKAIIYLDGKAITGKWKKANENSRTLFYDDQGLAIKINPGVSWYEIVGSDMSVTTE